MYAAKPFNENIRINVTSTMYQCKSYFPDEAVASSEQQSTTATRTSINTKSELNQETRIADLTRQVQFQLRRLERLRDKSNQFCEDLNLSHLIVNKPDQQHHHQQQQQQQQVTVQLPRDVKRMTTKTNKAKSCVDDIVIQFNADYVPYSLLILFNQMTLKFKTFITFHLHGSLLASNPDLAKLNRLIEVFNQLGVSLNKEARNSYDYGLTLIAKKFSSQESSIANLAVSLPQTLKRVYGESNAARFLNRLLGATQSNQASLQVDEQIDKCTNSLKSQDKNAYLSELTKSLTGKFLGGERPNLADYLVWSLLKQQNLLNGKLGEWSKRLESFDPFIQVLSLF